MPYVARLAGNAERLLLLAEAGLLEREVNVAFDADGRTVRFAYRLFDPVSVRELDLEAAEITDAQRRAFSNDARAVDRAEERRRTIQALNSYAAQHPFRQDAERVGGKVLAKGHYEWADVIARLTAWLVEATDEDVIGDIGNYAGREWLTTTVPAIDGGDLAIGIHADTRAVGVASFLTFVDACGGAARVRGERTHGPPNLLSADRTVRFGAPYFYL